LNILITGKPGVGKTILLNKLKESLEQTGYVIGGVSSPEILKNNKRIGFSLINLMNKKRGILSHVKCHGPRVGRYKINLKDLNEIGAVAIEEAIMNADYIFIDEIAPMELYSKKFCQATNTAFTSEKPVIAVIHKKSKNPFINEIKNRKDVLIFEINLKNRNIIFKELLNILKFRKTS
jgi:nucleoside-triphosphatase